MSAYNDQIVEVINSNTVRMTHFMQATDSQQSEAFQNTPFNVSADVTFYYAPGGVSVDGATHRWAGFSINATWGTRSGQQLVNGTSGSPAVYYRMS